MVIAGAVAELARVVVSPCVGVSIAAHGQRVIASGTHLHVSEILGQVSIRLVIRDLRNDGRSPLTGCSVAELAILVVSPGVRVPVVTHG